MARQPTKKMPMITVLEIGLILAILSLVLGTLVLALAA
jgi:energy-converting hydrogenase Eha subunit C